MFSKKKGGESVSGGTYWNFNTGERVRVQPGGQLPGAEKDVYYRIPRWVLFAMIPIAGILLVDIIPNAVKSVYAQQTEQLVFSYAAIVFGFMGVALALVFAGVVWDALSLRELTMFGWRPGEAYFSGTGKKKKDDEKKDEEKK